MKKLCTLFVICNIEVKEGSNGKYHGMALLRFMLKSYSGPYLDRSNNLQGRVNLHC